MTALTIAGANDLALIHELQGMFEGFDASDLSEGIAQSYPIVSFKGKVWRIKHKGEEKQVLDPTTGDPVASIIAVIVKASPAVSKLFYNKNFEEGDDAKPDCFSLDGVRPDASVQQPPSPTCINCPKNAWGSKITNTGQQLKACADHKRLAIVPFGDLRNEGNGPMLLRVPPASLQNLAGLAAPLKKLGSPYQAVAVKISFDHNLAYPKLTFTPSRALTKEQASVIKEYLDSGELDRMLMEPSASEKQELAQAPTAAARPASPAPAVAGLAGPSGPGPGLTAAQPETPKPTAKQVALDEGQEVVGEENEQLKALLDDILG
jgi:hypothetical protein